MRLSNLLGKARCSSQHRLWLSNGLVLLLLGPLLAFSLSSEIRLSPGSLCMVYAASTVLAGWLLLPLPAAAWALGGWSVLAVVATWLPLALHVSSATAFPPALAAGVLLFLLGSLLVTGTAWRRDTAIVRLLVLTLLGLATGAPVWLGPVAEQWADIPGVVDAVVVVSPLSYLAGAAHEDYLRGVWFYQHTPVGSLRYSYLPTAWYTGIYLVIAVGALAGRRWLLYRQRSSLTAGIELTPSTV